MIKINLLAGVISFALAISPLGIAQQRQGGQPNVFQHNVSRNNHDSGIQEAIAYQRLKDREDAHQGKLELRHPSVNYLNADRRMDDSDRRHVSDPGEPQSKKAKKLP